MFVCFICDDLRYLTKLKQELTSLRTQGLICFVFCCSFSQTYFGHPYGSYLFRSKSTQKTLIQSML